MNIQYQWNILSMSCKPLEDGQQNVVIYALWQCIGIAQNGQDQVSAAMGGNTQFTYTQDEPFTPYDQLTQQQVLGWVWQQVNQADVEAEVTGKITVQIAPPVVTPPLPWSN
jgi:hypothetical protein